MKKNHILLKTNSVVCLLIILGFLITAILSYQANYSAAVENIEQVSTLTSEGIYYQLTSMFTRPVNVSLTMANDSLLKEYLRDEPNRLDDPDYVKSIQEYLNAYQKKYSYDSVFLVSTNTNRYYNFNGIDRVLKEGNPENDWYYTNLQTPEEYTLVVDNDEVDNADNAITVFVNCKIREASGEILGIVGVGLRVETLQSLLSQYDEQFHVQSSLIDMEGTIQVSKEYTGYQKISLFSLDGLTDIKDQILSWKDEGVTQTLWTFDSDGTHKRDYVVSRFIPELSWYLIVRQDAGLMVDQLRYQLYRTVAVIAIIVLTILYVITRVIHNFNRQIVKLTREREENFRKATEKLYDNIYEMNITQNRAAGQSTQRYFESLGVPRNTPYDEALKVIAEKQIKPEFRDGYLATFSPENVMKEYGRGNSHLRYDFQISEHGSEYFWMRIDAYIFEFKEDHSIHMFIYRKNIDAEKQKELHVSRQMQTDQMTGFLTKTATNEQISRILSENPASSYGFFIFDIDNFKQANDQYGHVFGDFVILEFSDTIRRHFSADTCLGRIGGDEFVAFTPIPYEAWLDQKAEELSIALSKVCTQEEKGWKMSASIGVAASPRDGKDFQTLYQNADQALYQAKQRGKEGFVVYHTRP